MNRIYREAVTHIREFDNDCPQIPGNILEDFRSWGKLENRVIKGTERAA